MCMIVWAALRSQPTGLMWCPPAEGVQIHACECLYKRMQAHTHACALISPVWQNEVQFSIPGHDMHVPSLKKKPYVYLHTRTTANAPVPPAHERRCSTPLGSLALGRGGRTYTTVYLYASVRTRPHTCASIVPSRDMTCTCRICEDAMQLVSSLGITLHSLV